MNRDQREWIVQHAGGYAKALIGIPNAHDDECCSAISLELETWAARHIEPEKSQACLDAASQLRAGDDGYYGEEANERLWMGRWGASGMPTLIPADVHWAAAMCATNVAPEFAGMLKMPWDAFSIELPPELGLVIDYEPADDGISGDFPIDRIGVMRHKQEPDHEVVSGKGPAGSDTWVTVLAWPDIPGAMWPSPAWHTCKLSDLGEDLERLPGDSSKFLRTEKLLGKLVIGFLMALQSGQSKPTSPKSKVRRARNGKVPTDIEFVVGNPVHVRMVDFVRDYVRLGPKRMRGAQSIQTLVRGHWKNQPCGAGRSERKFMHIEPYWRGPEDAPIAVRSHILSGGGQGA